MTLRQHKRVDAIKAQLENAVTSWVFRSGLNGVEASALVGISRSELARLIAGKGVASISKLINMLSLAGVEVDVKVTYATTPTLTPSEEGVVNDSLALLLDGMKAGKYASSRLTVSQAVAAITGYDVAAVSFYLIGLLPKMSHFEPSRSIGKSVNQACELVMSYLEAINKGTTNA